MWIDDEVGEAARKIRESRGLSIEALACKVGLSAAEVEAIEAGKLRLGAQRLFDYCSALQVPVRVFFEWQGDTGDDSDVHTLDVDTPAQLSH